MTGLVTGTIGLAAAAAVSARWNWWRPHCKGIPVPMYHQIGEAPAEARLPKLWVRPKDFKRQMEYVRVHGYTPMLFSELAAALSPSGVMPGKPVLVTFDDGYADNYEQAFPILRELNIKANIFLVHNTVGTHNAFNDPACGPWQRMLTWDQVEEMQASGLIEFGSHTMTHPDLAKLPLELARWEIQESKLRLEEKLGRTVTAFAYPYGSGAYKESLRELVKMSGYCMDFGIRQGISESTWSHTNGPLKRLLIRGDDYPLDFHLNLTRGKARL